jgi:hypothetical protein
VITGVGRELLQRGLMALHPGISNEEAKASGIRSHDWNLGWFAMITAIVIRVRRQTYRDYRLGITLVNNRGISLVSRPTTRPQDSRS